MKYSYSISITDFRTLYPAPTLQAGRNAGFKGAIAVCTLIGVLGVFCIVRGFGMPVGGFLIGLGGVSAAVAYLFDLRSVQRHRESYERNLVASYQRVHCREQRSLEMDENGFSVTCQCGVVTRPWSELTQMSENGALFVLGTRMDAQIIPKSAFHSEGEITRFRGMVREKLDHYRRWTSRPIDFALTSQDFRHAYLIHVLKGGGWRSLSWKSLTCASWLYVTYWIWTYVSPQRQIPMLIAFYSWLLFMLIWRMSKGYRKKYGRPIRIHFSKEGLILEDKATIARDPWRRFIGYLEDRRMFLLYYNPRLYRIIPKRPLANQEDEFRAELKMNVPPYNYRAPLAAPASEVPAR